MDATAGGAFLSLTIRDATTLVKKMASNQGWNEERTKMDLLMKRLDD
jgi:hypothetical protein